MSIQKFLATSMIYLSLSGSGIVLADDRGGTRKGDDGAVATSTSGADSREKPRSHTVGNDKLRFTVTERRVLEDYEASADRRIGRHEDGAKPHKQKPLPPGLQKRIDSGKALPPGWQAKVARGEVLPLEVYKAGVPLPQRLRDRLPPDPKGTVTIDVDGKVVRVYEATREIIDILK